MEIPQSRDAGSFLFNVGTWLSLVEHSLGVRGVGSSNLPVPTKKLQQQRTPMNLFVSSVFSVSALWPSCSLLPSPAKIQDSFVLMHDRHLRHLRQHFP
jgi:hypothetical protein